MVLFEILQTLKPYQEAKRIGIYLSMPSGEISTDAIVRHALAQGKQVFVPYLHKAQDALPGFPRSVMDMLELHSLSDYNSLKRDSWGIPTIDPATVGGRGRILTAGGPALDLILMPGVAFGLDPKSSLIRRLGHGKGFYDYFLHRYRERLDTHVEKPSHSSPGTNVLLYGLALEEQIVQSEIPTGEHDSLLHGLLVGDGRIIPIDQ